MSGRSLWRDKTQLPEYPPLDGDITADVLVIGGGMAGLLTAYMLTRAGADCVLVEADRLCGGVSGNTTGKITALHGAVFDKLIREFGVGRTRAYFEANSEALAEYKRLCRDIDCDFEERDAYVYSPDDAEVIRREAEALRRIGAPAELSDCPGLPFDTAAAVKLPGQAQFDPLRFAAGIIPGLKIYEHTKVRELIGTDAVCNGGRIRAGKIVVTTHFPIINKHGYYFLKMYQHRSYVLALSGAPAVGGMYVDAKKKGMSFRDAGEYLLVVGGAHRTGKKGGGFCELEAFARRYYPDAEIRYRFATQDCMTLDGMPYIGRYSSGTEGLYTATGFNKWGITGSMVSAMLLSDLILGRKNKYEAVLSPYGGSGMPRTPLRPQLAANLAEALLGWITPTTPRCPHLGCVLKWNSAEHTWDCPCHGSRFDAHGELIDNPATGGLRNLNR